jgi:hypothetical protein
MKHLRRLVILSILGVGVAVGWLYRGPLIELYQKHIRGGEAPSLRAKPDPVRYRQLIAKLQQERRNLAIRYAEARTAREISDVIRESQELLEKTLPEMMRCWLGTPWDFHGTCEMPGGGKIACGYFVSTILRDADFRVERFKLAKQPSQGIVRTFVPRKQMHITSGLGYEDFLDQVVARGPGIRIVGLDKHVAFLVVTEEKEIRFIHSSGADPHCVVDEDRDTASSLKQSQYRVTGNLTRNPEIIHGWLTAGDWPTYEPAD